MSEGENTASTADPVELLVGEGRKYKTVQDLAKSRLEADNFIEQLQSENAALRELAKDKTKDNRTQDFKDFLAELTGKPSTTEEKPSTETKAPVGITPDQLEAYLERREAQRRQQEAFETVKSEFRKKFGDKGDESFVQALKSSGMTEEQIKSLPPQTALRALGFTPGTHSAGSAPASVGSEAFFGAKPNVRNYAFYKDLKAKMGEVEYYSPKIQNQLMKDRMEQGDDFWKT